MTATWFATARRQRALSPEDPRAPERRTRHGITPRAFEDMVARQGGACLVCRRPFGRTPQIDHDHALAELHPHPATQGCPLCVRGLLCMDCNLVLGHAHDDPEILLRAAEYVLASRG